MQYSIDDLLYLMRRLRAKEDGCPWDLEQTATTIINYSLEEVYELADAIERGDKEAERDELGDLLFQVIFLARLAEEQQRYSFADVVQGLCEKLVRRHPHVFTGGQLYGQSRDAGGLKRREHGAPEIDAQAVATNWEAIKRDERAGKQQTGLFADLPRALPALQRARKIQKRAAFIGLDWPDAQGALASLGSEMDELREAIAKHPPTGPASCVDPAADIDTDTDMPGDQAATAMANELGDVLFSCVNVARKLGLNPEQCLRQANRRFIERAKFVAKRLPDDDNESGQTRVSASELDSLWQLAKDSL